MEMWVGFAAVRADGSLALGRARPAVPTSCSNCWIGFGPEFARDIAAKLLELADEIEAES